MLHIKIINILLNSKIIYQKCSKHVYMLLHRVDEINGYEHRIRNIENSSTFVYRIITLNRMDFNIF